ncbi:hypothetical protein Tco_1250865 [Tanacetum coccineum]
MVAFGEKLKDQQIQEWNGYYINYKLMKKKEEKVEQYSRQIQAGGLERRFMISMCTFLRCLQIWVYLPTSSAPQSFLATTDCVCIPSSAFCPLKSTINPDTQMSRKLKIDH